MISTSRLRCPRSCSDPSASRIGGLQRLLPGRGIPGHGWLLALLLVGYFQVAESKIVVSQVIAVSMRLLTSFRLGIGLLPGRGIPGHRWSPGGVRRISQSGFSSYFQVALSQVMCVLHLVASCRSGRGTRVTSRLRNPRSFRMSFQVVGSYFQVAESKVAVSQVIGGPFQIGSELLPGSGFEGDAVPGHGFFLSSCSGGSSCCSSQSAASGATSAGSVRG